MKSHVMPLQITIIMILFVSTMFGACSALPHRSVPTPTGFQTPDIPNWNSTPSNPRYANDMPESLSCALVPQTPPARGGIVWHGLTIGVSTLEDVKKALLINNVWYGWDKVRGNLLFQNPDYFSGTWSLVHACFAEEKLAAIDILATDFYKPLPDILAEYGNPDRVTWGNYYEERSLIWPEKGLLIVVGVGTNNEVRGSYAILFSPVPRCELEQSWVFQSLPKEGQPITGDVVHDISSDEDPWKIEKGLADCPKE
jgi:hypothetical protein